MLLAWPTAPGALVGLLDGAFYGSQRYRMPFFVSSLRSTNNLADFMSRHRYSVCLSIGAGRPDYNGLTAFP